MIKVKTITLHRAEGPTYDLGTCTFENWDAATEKLRHWAMNAPKAGDGYHKVDFEIVWEDGERYKGRYDLVHFTVKTANLRVHVMRFVRCNAGKDKPLHWTPEQYQTILARSPDTTAWCKKALEQKRDIGMMMVA